MARVRLRKFAAWGLLLSTAVSCADLIGLRAPKEETDGMDLGGADGDSGGASGSGGSEIDGGSGGEAPSGGGDGSGGDPAGDGGTGSGGDDEPGTGGASGGDSGDGGTSSGGGSGGSDPVGEIQVYLLFGETNMWGVPDPEAVDLETNPKVEVLTLEACAGQSVNEWVEAAPPLHGCVGVPGNGNPGLGPGDYFARTLAAAHPDDTILLVPCAQSAVSIDVFQPGQPAYGNMVLRAELAQERGEIRGILMHQGENDSGSGTWTYRVGQVVDALREDLNLDPDVVPFLAGELRPGGCCATSHNPLVANLAEEIENAHVVSAADLTGDAYTFDLEGQRALGVRYGEKMLELLTP